MDCTYNKIIQNLFSIFYIIIVGYIETVGKTVWSFYSLAVKCTETNPYGKNDFFPEPQSNIDKKEGQKRRKSKKRKAGRQT